MEIPGNVSAISDLGSVWSKELKWKAVKKDDQNNGLEVCPWCSGILFISGVEGGRAEVYQIVTSWAERVHSASSNIYPFYREKKVSVAYVKGKVWSRQVISKLIEFLFNSFPMTKVLTLI